MFKKLVKKGLPIIMATMLVASTNVMSAFAVETVAEEGKIHTYIDRDSGVKFECKDFVLTEINVSIAEYSAPLGWYDEQYSIELLDDDCGWINFEDVSVTAYLPCEKENCNVIMDNGSNTLFPVEAEYVDGYYKFNMSTNATYSICDYPLAKGDGELVQQTLVDEKTGVSVSGMIQSESALAVKDIRAMYKEIIEEVGFEAGIIYGERPVASGENYDGYSVRVARNLVSANTDGELTITLPCPNKDYEVRCINEYISKPKEVNDEWSALEDELISCLDTPAEEMAKKLTTFADKVYPVIESEYIDGSYVVKNDSVGYYILAPKDSFIVTADYVEKARKAYEEPYDDSCDPPVDYDEYSDIESTEASTNNKDIEEQDFENQDNNNIYVIIAVIGVVVIGAIVIVVVLKKRTKNS